MYCPYIATAKTYSLPQITLFLGSSYAKSAEQAKLYDNKGILCTHFLRVIICIRKDGAENDNHKRTAIH